MHRHLILEGVSSDIASANWDGLVERAVDVLTTGHPAVVVCVRPDDLREPGLRARLFKFHRCAVKAGMEAKHFVEFNGKAVTSVETAFKSAVRLAELGPGISPHTFATRSSDMADAERCRSLAGSRLSWDVA